MSRKVINSTDKLAPITEYTDNVSSTSRVTPTIIKRKINSRKKLLTRLRHNPNEELKSRVANLSTEIKHHFYMSKRRRVRKGIILKKAILSVIKLSHRSCFWL